MNLLQILKATYYRSNTQTGRQASRLTLCHSTYFEAMRRLRPEPPDEETVERIVEIARKIWRKQDQEKLAEQEGVGVEPPVGGP